MMEWYQVGSFFFTNGLRIILGLYLAITVLNLSVDMRKTFLFSVCTSALVTVLCCFSDRQFYAFGALCCFAAPFAHIRASLRTEKLRQIHASMICRSLSVLAELFNYFTSFILKLILPILSLPRQTTFTTSPRVRSEERRLVE